MSGMKKLAVFILALLPVLAFVPERKALPESAEGETRYAVHFIRGNIKVKMATATLQLHEGSWQEKPAYNASFTVRAANVFKLFLLNEYKVHLFLSKADMHPYYYAFPHKKKGKQRHLEFFYREQEVESVLRIGDNPEPVRRVFPDDGRPTMDVASMSFFLRSIDPTALKDKPLRVNLLLASMAVPADVSYIGTDSSFWPGESTQHLMVKMQGRGLMENGAGDEIHLWISQAPERAIRGLQVNLGKNAVVAKMERSE